MTKKARIAELERRVEELERKEQRTIIVKVAPVIVPIVAPEPSPVWPWYPYPYETGRPWRYHDWYVTRGDTTALPGQPSITLGFPSVGEPDGTITSLL